MTFRRIWCRSLLPLALLLWSGEASAQGEDKAAKPGAASKPEAKGGEKAADDKTAAARAEYQKAAEQFSGGNFMEAVKGFKKAYGLRAAPALLFNIAVCYRKLDEKDLAAFYLDKFLKEADAKAPNRAEAEKQLAELKGQGATVAVEAPAGPAAPPQWKTVDKFEHVPPDEAPPGKPLDIRAMVPEKGGPYKLMMYWRAAGQADFTIVEMQRRYFEFVGRIPATAMGGKSVQYYLIVKDATGKTYAKAGSPTQPNLVLVVEGAKPAFYADLGEGMTATEPARPAEPARPVEPPKPTKGEDTESPLAAKNQPPPPPPAAGPTRSGGPTWMTYGKFGATGVSMLCFVVAIAKNGAAASAGDELEKAARSQQMGGEPRSFFSGMLAGKEKEGRDAESMATLMTSLGIGFAVAAGTLFYFDYRAGHGGERAEAAPTTRSARVVAAPAIGAGFFGLTGQVQF